MRVFRRVVDEIPLQLITRVELNVSGRQREELLEGLLPAAFIPMRLDSRLPARLEPDGRLRIQVRPGNWTVEFTARHPGETSTLALAEHPSPWPEEEVWVFDARNHLRLVEIVGPVPVDTAQTALPESWRPFPAYLMQPGAEMRFRVIRRGDPEPAPDALSLQRHLWLDFDGGGYTIQDTIHGTMTRGWRLEMNAPTQLGQATLDGEPQFVTARGDAGKPGFEVRRGSIDLTADSRYEASRSRVPAVGWDQDFQRVDATLHLPPGWKLFSVGGVDNAPDTWFKRWTLLDIFLVLIAALAVRGLWRWPAGLLALVALALIWHEPGAPRVVWLHVLAPVALLRVLPEGWFRTAVSWYRNLALLALIVIAVPFMVNQVRLGLYPQLDTPSGRGLFATAEVAPAPPPPPALAPAPAEDTAVTSEMMVGPEGATEIAGAAVGKVARKGRRLLKQAVGAREDAPAGARLEQLDPDALVQTGSGVPDWQWRQIPLNWNGPVQRDQDMTFVLLSPAMNLVLSIARTLLVVALALVVFGRRAPPWPLSGRGAAALLALSALPGLSLHAPPAAADLPDAALLKELETRLTAAPDCLPECAQVPRMRVELEPDTLIVRLEVHAVEDVAVPLPARAGSWLPADVSVDGVAADALLRAADGTVWIRLEPGAHQVLLRGAPPPAATFQLPLPLSPRRVDAAVTGWSVDGIEQSVPVGAQLQFTRVKTESTGSGAGLAELQPGELPPLLRVERTLRLGLEWRVETHVRRISPQGSPVVVRVPLLPGEAVLTGDLKIEDGHVLVSLGARDAGFGWESTLAKAAEVRLVAPDNRHWTEVWRADVSPIWHMEPAGIAVVHHQDPQGRWLPEWRPWPGESVTLAVTRPRGVPGRTLTVDAVALEVAPGKRATDTTAAFTLRSSRGGQHTLVVPDDAVLQSVVIDGVAQPIRQDGRSVTVPVHPGLQTVTLALRQPDGLGTWFWSAAVDAGAPSVNTRVHVTLGRDRWVLMLGGLPLGPAVLYWGVLTVIALIAYGLGRLPWTPLGTGRWFLLGVGLSQSGIWTGLVIVGWLLALGLRSRLAADTGRVRFNALQVALFLLTLVALAMLFQAVKQGLLGYPQMQIVGNESSAWDLRWYQDRSAAALPRAWIVSVPLWVYRGLMLAWALWLAFALLRWLRWGWECMNRGGLWRSRPVADIVLNPPPGQGDGTAPGG